MSRSISSRVGTPAAGTLLWACATAVTLENTSMRGVSAFDVVCRSVEGGVRDDEVGAPVEDRGVARRRPAGEAKKAHIGSRTFGRSEPIASQQPDA